MRLRWSCSGSAAHLKKVHTSLATWLMVAGVPMATDTKQPSAAENFITTNCKAENPRQLLNRVSFYKPTEIKWLCICICVYMVDVYLHVTDSTESLFL